jgi:hypothetical protein
MVFLVNAIALLSLLPALYYTIQSLSYNFSLRMSATNSLGEPDPDPGQTQSPKLDFEDRRGSTTVWVLGWLELIHLVPLGSFLLYSLILLKYLHYYNYSL